MITVTISDDTMPKGLQNMSMFIRYGENVSQAKLYKQVCTAINKLAFDWDNLKRHPEVTRSVYGD